MTTLLGRTTAGTTTDFNAAGNTAIWRFVAVASGVLAFIKAQTKVANTATAIRFGIYSDSAGVANTLLDVASVDVLATGNSTGVAQATMLGGVSIVSGTAYWLGWIGVGDARNFQGDAAGSYQETLTATNFPTPWPSSGAGSVNAILWGEDSGAGTPAGTPDIIMSPMMPMPNDE
jgi:hypothetical protein